MVGGGLGVVALVWIVAAAVNGGADGGGGGGTSAGDSGVSPHAVCRCVWVSGPAS